MLNMSDEFFEHLIQGTTFTITLTEERLKSKQQFHLQPHEWSHWKQGCECRGTFKRQLFLHIRQISSSAVTNCQALQWAGSLFTTHNCKATVFNLPTTLASNQFGEVISPLLMFIKCYIWAKGLSWKTVERNVEKIRGDTLAWVSTRAALALNAFHQAYINIPSPRRT